MGRHSLELLLEFFEEACFVQSEKTGGVGGRWNRVALEQKLGSETFVRVSAESFDTVLMNQLTDRDNKEVPFGNGQSANVILERRQHYEPEYKLTTKTHIAAGNLVNLEETLSTAAIGKVVIRVLGVRQHDGLGDGGNCVPDAVVYRLIAKLSYAPF